jgi:malate permease and related proteins
MIYDQLFNTVMPVAICVGIGYIWALLKRPFDTNFTSDLVINIGTPCLVVTSLVSAQLQIGAIVDIFFATALVIAVVGLAAVVSLRAASLDLRVFLPSMMFGNIGNMGLPICLFAFGKEGLALAVAYFTTTVVAMFILGPAISQAGKNTRYLQILKQPILVSLALALCIIAAEIHLPLWLFRPIQLVGDITIPLMLLTLGVSLKQLKWVDTPKSIFWGTSRIILGFGAAIAVTWMLNRT